MYCIIGHDSYSRDAIDQRWINGSKPLRTRKLARSKLMSWIAKRVKDRRLSTVEMRPGVDLWLAKISQPILAWIQP